MKLRKWWRRRKKQEIDRVDDYLHWAKQFVPKVETGKFTFYKNFPKSKNTFTETQLALLDNFRCPYCCATHIEIREYAPLVPDGNRYHCANCQAMWRIRGYHAEYVVRPTLRDVMNSVEQQQ